MLNRMAPLRSGRDTEIDMIEREMEGGVVVIQPHDEHEHNAEERVDGLISIEEHVDVCELAPKPSAVPKA